MNGCIKCGASEDMAIIYDAISEEGIVKICKDCALKESIPIIRNVKKRDEKEKSVYDRLSKIAGLNPEEHKRKFIENNSNLDNQETSLREVVEKNFKQQVEKTSRDYPKLKEIVAEEKFDLIEHYNWKILKARRARKISYKELAKEINEPEPVVRLAERGILPNSYQSLIRKIETALGINLLKQPQTENKEVTFDPATTKRITISELKEMDEEEKKEKKSFFPYWKEKLGFGRKKRDEEDLNLSEEDFDYEEDVSVNVKEKDSEEGETILEDIEKYEKAKEVKENVKKDPGRDLTKEEIDKILYGK